MSVPGGSRFNPLTSEVASETSEAPGSSGPTPGGLVVPMVVVDGVDGVAGSVRFAGETFFSGEPCAATDLLDPFVFSEN